MNLRTVGYKIVVQERCHNRKRTAWLQKIGNSFDREVVRNSTICYKYLENIAFRAAI